MNQSALEQASATFPATDWSLLAGLRSEDSAIHDQSANTLVASYWPPVFAWLRQHGIDHNRAAELTQSFFVEVVLGRKLFEKAQCERGRLRSLIRTALKNYVHDASRRQSSRNARLTISAGDFASECAFIVYAGDDSPESAFDRRWAVGILEEAINECQYYYTQTENRAYWNAFNLWVLHPLMFGSRPVPREEIARLLGFSNEAHVSVAIRLVKLRLRRIVKRIVAQTLDDPADVSEELALLDLVL